MTRVRPAAVAGTFYPGSPRELERTVLGYLSDAEPERIPKFPKGLIVPHAGYVYSGPVAATAYATLGPHAVKVRRVVLLGPAHRYPLRGVALPGADWFETPLGKVEIDGETVRQICEFPQVGTSPEAHALEHSLEVQLPFLQKVLPEFKLVPLVVGDARPEEIADVLETIWGGEETLLVISTDLSHYLPYQEARRVDRETAEEILKLECPIAHDQACGAAPINGFLEAARRHHLRPELLDLRNSGDTAGDRRQVVGYGAFTFTDSSDG